MVVKQSMTLQGEIFFNVVKQDGVQGAWCTGRSVGLDPGAGGVRGDHVLVMNWFLGDVQLELEETDEGVGTAEDEPAREPSLCKLRDQPGRCLVRTRGP